jgi:AAA domain
MGAERSGPRSVGMGKGGGSDGRVQVLEFWRAVELFSPQSVPKLGAQERVFRVEQGAPLPWEPGHALGEAWLRESNAWQHSIFFGVYSLDGAYAELRLALGGGKEDGDPPRAGHSALAAFTVAEDGRVLLGSQTLSSCAWALSRAFAGESPSPRWLDGFERVARGFVEEFAELLALADDDEAGAEIEGEGYPVGAVVDHELLDDIRGLVGKLLGEEDSGDSSGPRDGAGDAGKGGRAIRSAVEIRVQSRPVGRTRRYRAVERDFLNSFIARDLGRVADAVKRGECGPALERYLASAAEVAPAQDLGRVDVERDLDVVRDLLAPDRVPPGRWPRAVSQPADLGQQLAVNTVIHGPYFGEAPGGLLSVNGPPGTGKTTMLRDLIAALLVGRAQRLAELDDPLEAFEDEPIRFRAGSQQRTVHVLREELTGAEIVLACATNAAAENVSAEIPLAEAIAPEWHDRVDYFTDIATNVLSAKNGTAEAAPRQAWALIAACLGSITRCNAFASAFWFGRRGAAATNGDSGEDEQLGLLRILKDHDPVPRDWKDAVAEFRSALDTATSANEERDAAARLFDELDAARHAAEEHAAQLSATHASLQRAQDALDGLQRPISHCAGVRALCLQALERHRSARPQLSEVLSSLGRIAREWRARDYELAAQLSAAERALADLEQRRAEGERAAAGAGERVRHHEAGERTAREQVAALEQRIADYGARWQDLFPSSVFPDERWARDSERARRELRAPWLDEAWNATRTEVFLAALRLHRAFVLATASKMRHTLRVAIDVMRDGSLSDIPADAALAAWQCLFMVVPVISTTFASVARLFRHLDQEALGFLLIDEAGQSTPQNAAGAIWRSRYTVVVGDPLQLEPVVTLPLGAQRDLQVAHGVPESLLPNHCSVQSLADRVTPVGTYRSDGDLWVGSPLNVHRRCEEPMFAIVNQIAYDEQMINHTPQREELTLPGSAWLHVAGERSEGHWIPEEGQRLSQLLAELAGHGMDFAEVFLIAPFRDVATRLGDYRRAYPGITAGTIHTTQGKEADVVILVLGGDPMRTGDKAWAAQRPNLLNVAVSRARTRLYVVGNREAWGGLAYFEVLAGELGATTDSS